jgi:hypothetical protein
MKFKGQAGGGTALATTIVTISVALIIGIFVFSTVQNSIDLDGINSSALNASVANVANNVFSGFNLAAIVVIVVAAAAILLVLRLFR